MIINILKYLLIIFVLILIAYEIMIFLTIDACLDLGGAWDYPKGQCVQDNNLSLIEIECLSNKGTWDNNLCKQ